MRSNKKMIDDLLNYKLSEEALDDISLDQDTLDKIDIAEVSDKLSKEFFRPGYDTFMADKKEEFRNLISGEDQIDNSSKPQKKTSPVRNVILLLMGLLLTSAVFYFISKNSKTQDITIDEVKQYAMLSYESTGALDANRGTSSKPNELSMNYDLLQHHKCSELVFSGKYPEQELWSQLYCAYQENNQEKIDFYKSQIIEKKYANYSKL